MKLTVTIELSEAQEEALRRWARSRKDSVDNAVQEIVHWFLLNREQVQQMKEKDQY